MTIHEGEHRVHNNMTFFVSFFLFYFLQKSNISMYMVYEYIKYKKYSKVPQSLDGSNLKTYKSPIIKESTLS